MKASEMFHRDELQLCVSGVLKVADHVLIPREYKVPCVPGFILNFPSETVLGVLDGPSRTKGSPEVVVYVPMSRQPFAWLDADIPHLQVFRFRQQLRADIHVVRVLDEFLPERFAPALEIGSDYRA